jgi:predicted  nucleic acid-binding Zn-ribbon protein
MSEKKVVRRTVALALGVICIILIAGLGGAMAYYTVTINNLDNKVDSQKATISQLNATIEDQNNTISQLNTDVTNLQNQNANLQAKETQLQTWLDDNKTLLNQTQTWLDNNITYYNSQIMNLTNEKNQLQAWLYSNITYYNSQIMNLTNEKNQLQTWLASNITYYNSQISSLDYQTTNLTNNITSLEAQISTLNATITQMEEWLARGPPADHLAVANTVQAWYPTVNLTKQFLFNCIDEGGTESNWAWWWTTGSMTDAAAFMSIIINPANTSIEFCRCDAAGGDELSVSINGTIYTNIFSNSSWGLIGYWNIVK